MPRIAIVAVDKDRPTETFIHNHVRHLPADVHFLTGDWVPLRHCRGLDGTDEEFVPGHVADGAEGADGDWEQRKRRKAERAAAIGRYLQAEKIDAVLAEYGLAGVEMLEICLAIGIPLVVHFHGFDAYRRDILEDPVYGRRYPELFAGADALIVVSKAMRDQLIELGAASQKLHWNPCGSDPRFAAVQRNPGTAPVFLAVGRFTAKKAPHLTLLAFSRVHRSHPGSRLVFLGDGPLQAACRGLAASLGIADAVRFAGVTEPAEVAAAMTTAHVFVQHSVVTPDGDSEGTPVAVTEASAAGLPVVATRHGGIPDVVLPDETGLLVDEGDVPGMAEAMLRLIEQPTLAARLGAAGRERVIAEFSLESHIARLWTVIEDAIRSR